VMRVGTGSDEEAVHSPVVIRPERQAVVGRVKGGWEQGADWAPSFVSLWRAGESATRQTSSLRYDRDGQSARLFRLNFGFAEDFAEFRAACVKHSLELLVRSCFAALLQISFCPAARFVTIRTRTSWHYTLSSRLRHMRR
jgi:hypothetical protein